MVLLQQSVMLRSTLVCAVLLALSSSCLGNSELKQAWNEVTAQYGEWGQGFLHERRGQICDTYRQWGQDEILPDAWPGCTVVFIADPDDEYDLGTVAEGEQDNFLNTQHYNQAWNLHGKGFLGNSLPRAPTNLHPVCVIANVDGQLLLGYEEGNGDKLLPCPGHDEGVPFTEEMIRQGMNGERDLDEMCSQCYQAVCTGERSVRAKNCGDGNDGGKDLEDTALFVKHAQPVYHCHLTMADEGACDFVQYNQHESSRTYYMDYSVLCCWNAIQHLNITYCDCTKEAGTNNNCKRHEAIEMAYAGVVCGNCNGAGFSTDRAFESIFSPPNDHDPYDGQCGKFRSAEEGWGKEYARMMCSKGIWCPDGYNGGDNCKFHCDQFGTGSEHYVDPGCGDYPNFPTELCTDDKCFYVPDDEEGEWAEGETLCQSLGGHRASITSEAEEAIVQRLRVNTRQRAFWIGLNDKDDEGAYVWTDGSVFDFDQWRRDQPNDDGTPEQDCMLWLDDGWQDKPCDDDDYAFLCSAPAPLSGDPARRLLASASDQPRAVTLDTRFDWGHVISDVRATGYVKQRAANFKPESM